MSRNNWDDYSAKTEDSWLVERSARCNTCGGFKVQPENVKYDEKGMGYTTRLTHCPYCGKLIILGYIEDPGFSRLNSDRRYF